MQFSQFGLLYLLIGLGVMIGQARLGANRHWGVLLGVCLFWPLYVPFLVGTTTPSIDSPMRFEDEAANAMEDLHQLLKLTHPDSELSQKVQGLRDSYNTQLNWLRETVQLLDKHATMPSGATADSAATVELRTQMEGTTVALRDVFSAVRNLVIEVQLWKRSEDSSSQIETRICERIEQLRIRFATDHC